MTDMEKLLIMLAAIMVLNTLFSVYEVYRDRRDILKRDDK